MSYFYDTWMFAYVHADELYFDHELRHAVKSTDSFDDADENIAQAQIAVAMIRKYMKHPETLPKIEYPLSRGQLGYFEQELKTAVCMCMDN